MERPISTHPQIDSQRHKSLVDSDLLKNWFLINFNMQIYYTTPEHLKSDQNRDCGSYEKMKLLIESFAQRRHRYEQI